MNIPAEASAPRSLLSRFVDWNAAASRGLDRLLFPDHWRASAVGEFGSSIVPSLVHPGMTAWDVGCGSRPMINRSIKRDLGLTVIGVDVDPDELALMAPGACDKTIVADLCGFSGDGSADLVICKTVLEHVPDVDRAFAGLVSMLRPGGTLALCVPCRNALFARLNLLLPEKLKQRLLYSIWPHKNDGHCGFPAHYDRCTPSHFLTLAERSGLHVQELHAYWWATYFTFFVPLWALWRLWQGLSRLMVGAQACEGFVMVATKGER